MTVTADTLYLPVPASYKVEVRDFGLPKRQPGWRQPRARLYRVPPLASSEGRGAAYGVDGRVTVERVVGRLIDIFV